MKLVENDGTYTLSIDLEESEFDTLSVISNRAERALWKPWQQTLTALSNDPDNIELLEKKRVELAEKLTNIQASVGEKIDNNPHFQVMMQAYEEAGEKGLTDEELEDECVRIQSQAIPSRWHAGNPGKQDADTRKAIRKGWPNRVRSIRAQFHSAGIIIKTKDKRPTASSKARHLAQGIEPTGTAAVWRKRNLPIGDEA
jgi:hypothetical protein